MSQLSQPERIGLLMLTDGSSRKRLRNHDEERNSAHLKKGSQQNIEAGDMHETVTRHRDEKPTDQAIGDFAWRIGSAGR